MLKILLVVPDFYPSVSGYGNACLGLVQALSSAREYTIDVLTFVSLNQHEEIRLEGVRVHRLGRTRVLFSKTLAGEIVLIRTLRRLTKELAHDFIFFETGEFPIAALYAVRSFGDRVIVRVHASAETEWILFRRDFHYLWKRPFTKWLFWQAKNIFSTSRHYIGFVKKWYLKNNPLVIAQKRFLVVPNSLPEIGGGPVPVAGFSEQIAGRILLVTLGRMDYHGELQKNFRRLLEAIARLRQEVYFPRLMLLLVGQGDVAQELRAMAVELGIADNVRFYEALANSEVQFLQTVCHGVVLASTFEGLSIFALEALSNGAPLLVSQASGLADLVRDRQNGLTFDPLDSADIAEKIHHFVTDLVPRLESVRQASKEHYEANFAGRTVVAGLTTELKLLAAIRRSKQMLRQLGSEAGQ